MAEQQCDGTLSPEAARALETVLETKRFSHDPRGGLERGANELVRDHETATGLTLNPPMCRAQPPTGMARVDIRFGLYVEDDLFGDVHPRGLHPYGMGVEAQAGPKKAYLFVRCVSPRLKGSDTRPARIRGTLVFNRSELPDTVPVREATLTVLHSVTLAVVRKLDCEDNAGLDEKPVFRALPE
ncbi:hypothetical protein [Streptomyces hydrogenans]|uniref:hypothetical protein n=1 Tax=Streptomyces hydrogenans TaxID=1873719 RepID=UPI00363EBFBA